jgi:hypothetical protein
MKSIGTYLASICGEYAEAKTHFRYHIGPFGRDTAPKKECKLCNDNAGPIH